MLLYRSIDKVQSYEGLKEWEPPCASIWWTPNFQGCEGRGWQVDTPPVHEEHRYVPPAFLTGITCRGLRTLAAGTWPSLTVRSDDEERYSETIDLIIYHTHLYVFSLLDLQIIGHRSNQRRQSPLSLPKFVKSRFSFRFKEGY